jgi:hypothetical protein
VEDLVAVIIINNNNDDNNIINNLAKRRNLPSTCMFSMATSFKFPIDISKKVFITHLISG